MKGQWLVAVVIATLAGCSAQPDTTSFNADDWQTYGYEEGVAGHAQLISVTGVNGASYMEGYELGRQEYCEQDAFELGKLQRPYRGVCDEINPDFRSAYVDGTWWNDYDISD